MMPTTSRARPRYLKQVLQEQALMMASSEGFQELDQRRLLGRAELGAVGLALVAAVAVAGQRGVEAEEFLAGGFGDSRHEADLDRVVDVVAAIEGLGPLGR